MLLKMSVLCSIFFFKASTGYTAVLGHWEKKKNELVHISKFCLAADREATRVVRQIHTPTYTHLRRLPESSSVIILTKFIQTKSKSSKHWWQRDPTPEHRGLKHCPHIRLTFYVHFQVPQIWRNGAAFLWIFMEFPQDFCLNSYRSQLYVEEPSHNVRTQSSITYKLKT